MENQDTENTAPEVEETTEQEASVEEAPALKSSEVIDVEWEEVEQIYKVNQYSKQLESQLAEMCVRHEKTKMNILTRISECETFLFSSGNSLKDSSGIDPSLTYELKLPEQEGEKAFFLRKDA